MKNKEKETKRYLVYLNTNIGKIKYSAHAVIVDQPTIREAITRFLKAFHFSEKDRKDIKVTNLDKVKENQYYSYSVNCEI